jgi:hypothetical protein
MLPFVFFCNGQASNKTSQRFTDRAIRIVNIPHQ